MRAPRTTLTLVLCCLGALLPGVAAGQSPAPGDSYLNALRLNPGNPDKPDPIPAAGATFTVDTSSYGTQADIFNPPGSGGVEEPGRCAPARYGNTAWAWLHTDKWAGADVRSNGTFDNVLAVMPFTSPSKPKLSPAAGACVNRLTTGEENFGDDRPILAPGWFAVQVGGVRDAAGTAAGGRLDVSVQLQEPPRLAVKVKASGRARSSGSVVDVTADAPEGTRVAFACVRGKCKLPKRTTVTKDGSAKYLRRASIPNGARLELRVTRAGYIGNYFAWTIRKGRVGKATIRCLEPASNVARKTCDG